MSEKKELESFRGAVDSISESLKELKMKYRHKQIMSEGTFRGTITSQITF